MTDEPKTGFDSAHKFMWEIYKDGSGRYRWRAYGDNMKVKERSNGAFKTEEECEADSRKHGMDGEYGRLTG